MLNPQKKTQNFFRFAITSTAAVIYLSPLFPATASDRLSFPVSTGVVLSGQRRPRLYRLMQWWSKPSPFRFLHYVAKFNRDDIRNSYHPNHRRAYSYWCVPSFIGQFGIPVSNQIHAYTPITAEEFSCNRRDAVILKPHLIGFVITE